MVRLTRILGTIIQKKIDFIKSGETFSDVSKRLMGQKVDSLGLPLNEHRSVYQSGQLSIQGWYDKPGHPISDVTQFCSSKWDLSDKLLLF